MGAEAILSQLVDLGLKLAVKRGQLFAEPKSLLNDETRALIREHKPEILAGLATDPMSGVSTEFAARLSAEDLGDIATGDIPLVTVHAFEQAAIARETEDLKEAFEERAGILEYDAGLPRPAAELEAARITATYARNRGYLWASLRARNTPSCWLRCPTSLAR